MERAEGFEYTFWKVVLLLNVGPIAVVFGVLYLFFEGWGRVPAASLAIGAVALGFAARSYRAAREEVRALEDEDDEGISH